MAEIWREVWDAPKYEVSDYGRIRNSMTDRFLTPKMTDKDVLVVNVSKQGHSVTRPLKKLVIEAFKDRAPIYDRKQGTMIRHIDENPMNCAADNLAWCLRSEAAWIKRVGVEWGREVIALESGDVYEDAVDAAKHYQYGCDITIKRICMERDGWHCGETFRYLDELG